MIFSEIASPAPVAQPPRRSSIDAGPRLVGTYGLLEMALEEVPINRILSAQHVSQQLWYAIATLVRLQSKLLFSQGSSDADLSVTTFNTLVSQANILASLPISSPQYVPYQSHSQILCIIRLAEGMALL